MPTPRPRPRLIVIAALLLSIAPFGCSSPFQSAASYYLGAPLVPVGGGSGSGRVEVLLATLLRSLYVEASGLAPRATHRLTLDGVAVASFVTDAAGAGSVGRSVLDSAQDPRGRHLAVVDASGNEVLVLADASQPAYRSVELAPLASFAMGGGFVERRMLGGQHSLRVTLEGVDPGSYDVLVDGAPAGVIDATSGAGHLALAPSAIGSESVVTIQRAGVDLFAGSGGASIFGIDWCANGRTTRAFGAFVAGEADARLSTRVDCGRRFTVEVRGVPEGSYDLVVDGERRAEIAVGSDESGDTIGDITFGSHDTGDTRLDFDPFGVSFGIQQSGQALFVLGSFRP
jgi:hypothetical protein